MAGLWQEHTFLHFPSGLGIIWLGVIWFRYILYQFLSWMLFGLGVIC
jgi:hypothetical protein